MAEAVSPRSLTDIQIRASLHAMLVTADRREATVSGIYMGAGGALSLLGGAAVFALLHDGADFGWFVAGVLALIAAGGVLLFGGWVGYTVSEAALALTANRFLARFAEPSGDYERALGFLHASITEQDVRVRLITNLHKQRLAGGALLGDFEKDSKKLVESFENKRKISRYLPRLMPLDPTPKDERDRHDG